MLRWWRRALGLAGLFGLFACGAANAATLPAGSFVFDGRVTSIARSGEDVFVGGRFTQQQMPTGGGLVVSQSGSGAPDPSQFPRVAGTVRAVAPDGSGGWFIGGEFTHVGGQPQRKLAHIRSDGALDPAWNPGVTGSVSVLAVSGSTVYVGGEFTSIGGQPRSNLAALDAASGNATAWDPNPDGVDAYVGALAVSGSTVYAGGGFSSIGGQPRNNLAALDAATGNATAWNPNPDPFVYALAVSGSTVYAGGSFSSIGGQPRNGLAALDAATGKATAWNPDPVGLFVGSVSALAVSGSTVYAGGGFDSIGGQPRNGLAALDAATGKATAWNPNADYPVSELAVSGSTVYAGGGFDSIGGQPRNGLAALDAATGNAIAWNPNPNGLSVDALAVSGSTVYVGGNFSGAGPALATVGGVAKLNAAGDLDASWKPNPNPNGFSVDALAVSGSTVYAGGDFSSIGGQPRNSLAALEAATGNATAWNPDPGVFSRVFALAVSGSTVYVGGFFSSIGGEPRNWLAALDAATGNATAWNPHPGGPAPFVRMLTVSGSTVYAGGNFSSIGGQPRNRLAALDAATGNATAWNPNADGFGVGALAVAGSTVYAGGDFSSIGGQPRNRLAALDAASGNATAWNPNPDGVDAVVGALAVSGSTVYVGGDFDSIGGQPHSNLAAIDAASGSATAWNPELHRHAYSGVRALAVSESTVYAGGDFTSIGGWITGPFAVLSKVAPGDTTPPTITITTPTEGQRFSQEQSVSSVFSCDDANGSGVQTCSGPGTVDTTTVGVRQFTVTATDNAGNNTSKTVNYTVDAQPTGGGQPPPGGEQPPPGGGQQPPIVGLTPPIASTAACSGLLGSAFSACQRKEQVKRELADCQKKSGQARKDCVRQVNDRAACDTLTGRKKKDCAAYAKQRASCDRRKGAKQRDCIRRAGALKRCYRLTGKKRSACISQANKIGRSKK